jgi:hypothetical protein
MVDFSGRELEIFKRDFITEILKVPNDLDQLRQAPIEGLINSNNTDSHFQARWAARSVQPSPITSMMAPRSTATVSPLPTIPTARARFGFSRSSQARRPRQARRSA